MMNQLKIGPFYVNDINKWKKVDDETSVRGRRIFEYKYEKNEEGQKEVISKLKCDDRTERLKYTSNGDVYETLKYQDGTTQCVCKNKKFLYKKLTPEELELTSKSLPARIKELNAGTLSKELLTKIKELHVQTEGFTKLFKWVH